MTGIRIRAPLCLGKVDPENFAFNNRDTQKILPTTHSPPKMRFLLYFALFAFIGMLYIWSNDPETDPAAARVMTTTFYSLDAGVAVNVICALGAFFTDAVPRGMESDACLPYSIVTVAIAARLHTYGIGGYGYAERAYISDTSSRMQRYAWQGLGMAWEGVKSVFRTISPLPRDN